MVRLSVTIDPGLLEEVQRLAKAKTKREAIEHALREFVRSYQLEQLSAFEGAGLVAMELPELKRWRKSSIKSR